MAPLRAALLSASEPATRSIRELSWSSHLTPCRESAFRRRSAQRAHISAASMQTESSSMIAASAAAVQGSGVGDDVLWRAGWIDPVQPGALVRFGAGPTMAHDRIVSQEGAAVSVSPVADSASGSCSAASAAASLVGTPFTKQPGNALCLTYRSTTLDALP